MSHHDKPNIVADNHVAQVMSASLEYLGQNPESVLHKFEKYCFSYVAIN